MEVLISAIMLIIAAITGWGVLNSRKAKHESERADNERIRRKGAEAATRLAARETEDLRLVNAQTRKIVKTTRERIDMLHAAGVTDDQTIELDQELMEYDRVLERLGI